MRDEPSDVVFPTRVIADLGVKTFVITNAVGSMDLRIKPGSVVVSILKLHFFPQKLHCLAPQELVY